MLYSTLVEFYARLEATAKRLEMTEILAELFGISETDELEHMIYMTQGKIHPDWTGEPEIGMAEKMVVATISRASGQSKNKVKAVLSESGDVGLAAEKSLSDKRQVMFGEKPLSVSDVYNVFDEIANESGKGSSSRKIDRLVRVMMNSSPLGSRYIARTVVGTLRLVSET